MDLDVRIPHTGRHASPDFIRDWCVLADEAGFGTLWGVDHVIMPRRVDSNYVLSRTPSAIDDDAVAKTLAPNFELMTTLAYAAAVTRRIRLGSAVTVLTIRNALLNARQLATIDRYSGGRLTCGVGVGWLEEEARAMGMPWDRRGARADEHIDLLRTIWTATERHVEFRGVYWDVPSMDPEPRPVQQPIPILVGGHSDAAIDRAARIGDGWIAAKVSSARLAELMPVLAAAAERHGRPLSSLPVYCSSDRDVVSLEDIKRYVDLGVRSLQLAITTLDELKRVATDVLPWVPVG
jgi:probable F420-dependent oxidoreductase